MEEYLYRLEHALKQHDIALSMSTLTIAQIEGMKAENKQREIQGESLAYTYKDFEQVAIDNDMDYNAALQRHLI